MRQVIEEFIEEFKPNKYLEIGIGNGRNFRNVPVANKTCVSPSGREKTANMGTFIEGKSQDVLPKLNEAGEKYDLIFADGDHEYSAVMSDIMDAYKLLSDNGVLIVHDVVPFAKHERCTTKTKPENGGAWTGDCWKCIPHLLEKNKSIKFFLIEEFPGWLIIPKQKGNITGKNKYRKFDNMKFDTGRDIFNEKGFSSIKSAIIGCMEEL